MRKICIIKLKSAGDVIRTTPILRAFSGCQVTWITDEGSSPFIKGNPLIKDVIIIHSLPDLYKTTSIIARKDSPPIACPARGGVGGVRGGVNWRLITPTYPPPSRGRDYTQLLNTLCIERFDALYNFDEDESACRLAQDIPAPIKKGYGWKNGGFYPFDRDSEYAYRLAKDDQLKFKLNKKTYQRIIFEMAGLVWSGEDYALSYQPESKVIHRVGLNYMVGDKFPNKFWVNWRDLLRLVPGISVQVKFETPKDYINWINSCDIIVTSDSLGMHIALALEKKVVALFGETSMNEIEMYGRGVKLSAGFSCSPCYRKRGCDIKPSCMEMISAQEVRDAIKSLSGQ